MGHTRSAVDTGLDDHNESPRRGVHCKNHRALTPFFGRRDRFILWWADLAGPNRFHLKPMREFRFCIQESFLVTVQCCSGYG